MWLTYSIVRPRAPHEPLLLTYSCGRVPHTSHSQGYPQSAALRARPRTQPSLSHRVHTAAVEPTGGPSPTGGPPSRGAPHAGCQPAHSSSVTAPVVAAAATSYRQTVQAVPPTLLQAAELGLHEQGALIRSQPLRRCQALVPGTPTAAQWQTACRARAAGAPPNRRRPILTTQCGSPGS
eukprot:COSAG01_NODE_7633_length_3120_cov_6.410460_1_plen_178_part_10